ncbi:helix-turn-helix domain-containing protein [Rossellomorea marisflavi]
MEIGKKISELRKEANLTQGELARGTCTQSLISLIEKGETDPSAEVLFQIAKKLGVDVNYFFKIGSTSRLDYVNEVEKQLRRTRIFYQYNEMMEIVTSEEKNPMFYHDPRRLQLLSWHKSIYLAEEKKEYRKAIDVLREAIDLVPVKNRAYTELEMEMMMSLGGFEYRLKHFEEMLCQYRKVETIIESTNRIPF